MTAIVYLYDDDGNLIEKREVPPTDIVYSEYDGLIVERTQYCFARARLLNPEEIKRGIKNDSRTI